MIETLENQLSQLEAYGLVQVAQQQPELEYLFRHVLVQDAAYDSLLRQKRRGLHLAVGEALETLYPDRLEALAPVLGHHFSEAGDRPHALHYLTLAGDSAASRYANQEAATHYAAALALAHEEPDCPQLTDLYLKLGHTLAHSGRHNEAMAHYEKMQAVAQERGNQPMQLASMLQQATLRSTSTPLFDEWQAKMLCNQALTLARRIDDSEAEAKILWNLMLVSKFSGQSVDARRYGEQALALIRQFDDREQLAYILHDLAAHGYMATSEFRLAIRTLNEARELWEELGNLPMVIDNLATLSMGSFVLGEDQEAVEYSDEAWRLSESIQHKWGQSHSRFMAGSVHANWGHIDDALNVMEACVTLGREAGLTPANCIATMLALLYGELGQVDRGIATAQEAVDQVRKRLPNFLPWGEGNLLLLYLLKGDFANAHATLEDLNSYELKLDGLAMFSFQVTVGMARAEYALMAGTADSALELADALLKYAYHIEANVFWSELLYLKARTLLPLGKIDAAYAALNEARKDAEERSNRRMLWRILLAMSRIESERLHLDDARMLRDQAADVLIYILGHITHPDIRDSFLALPEVQEILGTP